MRDTFSGQSLRYALVGTVVYACDVGGFALLILIGGPGHYLPANCVSKVFAAMAGFLLHKHITFRWPQRDRSLRQFAVYVSLLLFNLGLSTLLIWIAVHGFGWPPLLGKIGTEAIVAGVSFLASRQFVFRKRAIGAA